MSSEENPKTLISLESSIKSRKPRDSKFHQQKLEAWKPEFTMVSVFPVLMAVGILFLIIGSILITFSMKVVQSQNYYTQCRSIDTDEPCDKVINSNMTSNFQSCICVVKFNITKKMTAPVYLYYQLENFNQNHRQYVKSVDPTQLQGKLINVKSLSSNCYPYRSENNNGTELSYAPCGVIANSLFNDTFNLKYFNSKINQEVDVGMHKEGIAWKIDLNLLYGKPKSFQDTMKPVNWPQTAFERTPDAYKDEELIVWMRISPLPSFRKLHRILNQDGQFKLGLPVGLYNMYINYSYPVSGFDGKKAFLLTNTYSLGGKNNFLGISYIVVGVIQILLAILFIIIPYFHKNPKDNQPSDMKMMLMKSSFSDIPLITHQLERDHSSYGLK